jgi:hypothetical protein
MATVGIRSDDAGLLAQFSLKGKTIVITGSGRGLGLNFANGLVQAGANIAGIDIQDKPHPDFEKLTRFGGKAKYFRFVSLLLLMACSIINVVSTEKRF